MTLVTIADTPHSIALGSAIGIFFGFTPLWSLKTLLSIVVAWVCRCNKIAAAIAVTLHDVLIFVMPAVYFAEYKLGLLDPPPARADAPNSISLWIARLPERGVVLAPCLAGVYRLFVPGDSIRSHRLFRDANAD